MTDPVPPDPSADPAADPAAALVADYDRGRLSRRQLAAALTGLGAATALAGRSARAGEGDEPDTPLFAGRNIDHVALSVTDAARSAAFYERHLGLKTLRADGRSAFLGRADGGFFLALFQTDEAGLNHFCFGIDDYDPLEAARTLRAEGREVRETSGRVYFKDPDGIEVQLSAKREP